MLSSDTLAFTVAKQHDVFRIVTLKEYLFAVVLMDKRNAASFLSVLATSSIKDTILPDTTIPD